MTRFRALKHRNFQLFIAGQLVSLIGTWMQTTAQLWLVYDLTHSPALLGIFGFANQIPMLVLASVGGYVGDRYSRHRGVIATQTISMLLAFILAGLTLSHHIHEWSLIAITFLVGIVNAFDVPIRQAFFVEMVGKEDLPNAIALNSSIFNGARVVGPAIAGFAIAWIGAGWCFFLNGLIVFSQSHVFWLSAAVLFVVGFAATSQMAATNTTVQNRVPDELRGRVMAVYATMFMGVQPLGALLAGGIAKRIGAPSTLAIFGSVCLIGSLVFAAWVLTRLRAAQKSAQVQAGLGR